MKKLLILLVFLIVGTIYAQDDYSPQFISEGIYLGETMPFRDAPVVTPSSSDYNPTEAKIIANRLRQPRKKNSDALPLFGDPILQDELGKIVTRALEVNFDGATAAEGGATPPDPTGAVGPDHYVHAVNLVIKMYDKDGTLVAGPTSLGDFFENGVNSGDPIVMYDQIAERYFISEFNTANNGLLIAISTTTDPTGTYHLYEFPLDSFPDYPHYSVWHDAYYMTANKFSGNTVYALEREKMIDGLPAQIVGFTLPDVEFNPGTVNSPEPANLLGTTFPADAPGYIIYLQDDGWGIGSITFDHLKVWEVNLDWDTIGSSSISSPIEIPTMPFESTFAPFGTGDVSQPGTGQKIDMIGGVISYMVNYRSFGGHNSMTVNFNVDTDGNDRSGIRWFELRNDASNPWNIFQEGTYTSASDSHSRFMGSMAMDAAGNIGLAFNIASGDLPVGIRYTGRFDGDPLGEMTVAETTIIDGVGVQTFSNRFGDYAHLTMDPNNFTFWHTAEYFPATNNWTTRIASFSLSGGFANDVGVNNIISPSNGVLTSTETVEVSVRNYGTDSQTNIPLQLRLDGSLIASEVLSGTILPGETATHTFTATVDLSTLGQTYSIAAKTALVGDEFVANDELTKDVTHLFGDDIGVTEILEPVTAEGMASEDITIRITNFGANSQTGFDVSYTVDGGAPVVETIAATIDSEESFDYTFTVPGDFSSLGSHTIIATTLLVGDEDPSNDSLEVTIENQECLPSADCSFGDGFTRFKIGTIDNFSGCSPDGYGDFTGMNTDLLFDETITVTAQTGFSNQFYSVWIDYNDNMVYEDDERVISDAPMPDVGSDANATFTIPFDASIIGVHLLRARAGWIFSEDTTTDPCIDFTYGETEDYTITLVTLSVSDSEFYNTELVIYPVSSDMYQLEFSTVQDFGTLYTEMYNTLGQKVYSNELDRTSSGYEAEMDLTSVSAGVYLVKVFNTEYSTVKRIIVK